MMINIIKLLLAALSITFPFCAFAFTAGTYTATISGIAYTSDNPLTTCQLAAASLNKLPYSNQAPSAVTTSGDASTFDCSAFFYYNTTGTAGTTLAFKGFVDFYTTYTTTYSVPTATPPPASGGTGGTTTAASGVGSVTVNFDTASITSAITAQTAQLTAIKNTLTGTSTLTPAAAFQDGMSIGWGVAAAMMAAVSILFIRRALP